MISIVIPCYNDNKIVPRAIQSALNLQSAEETEIILVDDGSDTPVQNQWNGKVKVVRHRHNKGLSEALNTGIKRSQGERFVILASDDELHPAYASMMAPHINADIISCNMRVGPRHIKAKPGSVPELMKGNCHSYAALINKNIWEKVGGFKPTMNPSWEDWEFFLSAAEMGATWHHVPMPLHIYHRNPNGRDANAQGKDYLLRGKLEGYHQKLYGQGRGVVTFVIPCYDHEKYLGDALDAVSKQIYPHINAIVVDDGSPGNVIKVAKEFDNVMVVRQKNKHLSGARNTGIREAIRQHNSQYLVMLDADDAIDPNFVERTLEELEPQTYIYTDIKFIGDAYHKYEVKNYDCRRLAHKHIHACTFLMPAIMYQAITSMRGYGYDERMKKGFEDWEFALAAVEAKWCGKRVPEQLFYYRYHNEGSMRTAAQKIEPELVRYIKGRHPWMSSEESIYMGCGGCGGRRHVRVISQPSQNGGINMAVNIPGVGQLEANEPISVHYNGSTGSTVTKVGQGGQIYKFSSNPNGTYGPDFTAFARDAHLFTGAFVVTKYEEHPPVPEPEPVAQSPADKAAAYEAKIEERLQTVVYDPDDLTELKYIGKKAQEKLNGAGFTYFEDVKDADPDELALVLGVGRARAKLIIKDAEAALSELV